MRPNTAILVIVLIVVLALYGGAHPGLAGALAVLIPLVLLVRGWGRLVSNLGRLGRGQRQ
jgi:hypothetical protein